MAVVWGWKRIEKEKQRRKFVAGRIGGSRKATKDIGRLARYLIEGFGSTGIRTKRKTRRGCSEGESTTADSDSLMISIFRP